MGFEREGDVGFILAAADPRDLWSSLPAPRAPLREPAAPLVPSPPPRVGLRYGAVDRDGAYWGVETVIGWQPRLLAVDPWCVSMHHPPLCCLAPIVNGGVQGRLPNRRRATGRPSRFGRWVLSSRESTCMAADETSGRCWPTLANAGDSWPKGDTSIDAGERGSNAVSPDSSHPVHGSSFVFHAHTDVGQHSWRNPTR